MSSLRRSRVKICGITSPNTSYAVAVAGADAIGIVFYAPSPRNVVDLGLAREIALACGPLINVVGLFVDPSVAEVEQVLREVPLSTLQFHGNENEAFCQMFERPFLKALRVKSDLDILSKANEYKSASGLLLDAYRPGVPGGTGEVFDWDLIPKALPRPLILAGGLNAANVKSAVEKVHPWGVDVSGGVESSPGIKDLMLVDAFVSQAKSIQITLTNESLS